MAHRPNCVIVDPDKSSLDFLSRFCKRIPNINLVGSFDSPAEFIEILPLLDFDICVLELNMPMINGIRIAELLNEQKEIIFITGTADNELLSQAFRMPHAGVVSKPFRKERLDFTFFVARNFSLNRILRSKQQHN